MASKTTTPNILKDKYLMKCVSRKTSLVNNFWSETKMKISGSHKTYEKCIY